MVIDTSSYVRPLRGAKRAYLKAKDRAETRSAQSYKEDLPITIWHRNMWIPHKQTEPSHQLVVRIPSNGSQCSRRDLSKNPVWMPASRLAAADRVSGVSGAGGTGST